jgi:hypothetical protein
MNAVTKIREVLSPNLRTSGLLIENLLLVPSAGSKPEAIAQLERRLPRRISQAHRAILLSWNGIDLDVIRILGVPPTEEGIRSIDDCQQFVGELRNCQGAVAFASDSNGFVYFELADGSVHSWDHDGGRITRMAESIDRFIQHVVFGPGGGEFGGPEWLRDLQACGLA